MDLCEYPVRFSRLKQLSLSPAHYRAALLEDQTDTPAKRNGRALHSMLLDGGVHVFPGDARRGKVWDDFCTEHSGSSLPIVTAPEHARFSRLVEALHADPRAIELLEGQREKTIDWYTIGRRCRGTPDVVGQRWVTELKTTHSSAPWRFPHLALRLHYHAQIAWYLDALRDLGHPADAAYIVAVEVNAPFAVTTWELPYKTLEAGRKLYRLWLERLLVCEASNDWPGYVQCTLPLDVPDDEGEFTLQVGGEDVDFADGAVA